MAKEATATSRKPAEVPPPGSRRRSPTSTGSIHEKTDWRSSARWREPDALVQRAKASLKTTDGNVSVHARKLEDAGYLSCKKSFEGRCQDGVFADRLGQARAGEYLAHMEALIKVARGSDAYGRRLQSRRFPQRQQCCRGLAAAVVKRRLCRRSPKLYCAGSQVGSLVFKSITPRTQVRVLRR